VTGATRVISAASGIGSRLLTAEADSKWRNFMEWDCVGGVGALSGKQEMQIPRCARDDKVF